MKTTVEHAILCANGKIHYGNEYLIHDDHERVRLVADATAEVWCDGAPHVIARRERIVTDWQVLSS